MQFLAIHLFIVQLYIRLIGSRAVTNRYTSEAQSPAPGTSHFERGWDILEGWERPWGWFWVFLFVFGCFSVFLFLFLRVAACLCVFFLAL
jgi:hypothetical protein